MLDTAVEWGLLDRLPRIKRLGVPPVEFDWLTRVESARFLESVEAHYPQWRALFYVALHTGMRRGEIFALRWRDLDIEGRRVAVRHNVWRGVLGTPKSGKHRVVPMTLTLARALVHHRSARCAGGELVFPGKGGRLTKHQDHVDRPLRGALGRAGLRCLRFHDLRHSFASQLVSAGRPLEQLRVLLGHASIITTQKYAHLAPARLWDAIDVLDQPI